MRSFKSIFVSLSTVCLFILAPAIVYGQWSIEGEFRPRSEYRNGYRVLRTPDSDPAFFVSQRARLGIKYQSDIYRIKIAGQDIRTWGGVGQLQDEANLNIHEAWAEVNLAETLGLKLGRQELVYDDSRLLGNVNWTQPARSHDALKLKFRDAANGFNVDIGAAYNQEAEQLLGNNYSIDNYKMMLYLWANKAWDGFHISALALTDGFQNGNGSVDYRYTFGTYLAYSVNRWNMTGSFYQQNGDDRLRRGINARMFAIKASHDLQPFRISTGYDYLSGGDAEDANPVRHTFSTLYATNHKFYGTMDYFLNIPADTRGGGLQDLHAKARYQASASMALDLTYHHFLLANKVRSPGNTDLLKKDLGSEFDLSVSLQFSDEVAFRLGYSALMPTSSLERIQARTAGGIQHWGWAMLILNPNISKE